MHRQFNTQQFYVLPTKCIYVHICEQTANISPNRIISPVFRRVCKIAKGDYFLSSCLSAHMSVHMVQLGSQRTDLHEN